MNSVARRLLVGSAFACSVLGTGMAVGFAQSPARDPGVRPAIDWSRIGGLPCPSNFVIALSGLTAAEEKLFCAGANEFAKEDKVKEDGLGPTMNFISCLGCHQYPRSGGSSPLGKNPQYEFARTYPPGTNVVPPIVKLNGRVVVARFKKHHAKKPGDPEPVDGGVHSLFTITGLPGAEGCILPQENFKKQLDHNNLTIRIPTPTFGAGLIEQIEDKTIDDNLRRQAERKSVLQQPGRVNLVQPFHTRGSENTNGNDGTIARFGWKAQNKSLLVFAGEA